MKHWLLSLLAIAGAVPGCAEKPATAIVVAIQPEMPTPTEVDGLDIEVQRGSNFPFVKPYDIDPGTRLPGTLTLTDDEGDPKLPLTITIRARRQGKEVVLRRATLGFSEEKTKLLRMPLRYGCWAFPDTCPSGQSCKAGGCASDDVDPETLPEFDEKQVFATVDTGCFDATPARCFGGETEVPLTSLKSCSIAVDGALDRFNLALHWTRAVAADALTVVDEDRDEGWSRDAGGVRVSAGLCAAIQRGEVARVIWSRACAPKQPLQPLCQRATGSDVGAGGASAKVDAGDGAGGAVPPAGGASGELPASGGSGGGSTGGPPGGSSGAMLDAGL